MAYKRNYEYFRGMEDIRLSKDEKKVLILVSTGEVCPDTFPIHIFNGCIISLERKGMIIAHYLETGEVVTSRLTSEGRLYLDENLILEPDN